MIDHMGLNVRDLARARAFYEQALEPLGYRVVLEFPEAVGMGAEGKPEFWLARRDPVGSGTHVAFGATDRETVDAFHAAGLAAGGTDHGAPGIRPHYHADYYGAFVLDPDGNNVEAVCHKART